MIDIADVYTRGFQVYSQPVYPATVGTLTTPASNVCTITLPDQTIVTPTLTVLATGVLGLSFTVTQAGLHVGRLTTVNPDSGHQFSFDVSDTSAAIVSLSDARDHLNLLGVDTSNDDELRFHVLTASKVVESIVGPVARRTIGPVTVYPRGGALILNGPIISLTSLTVAPGYANGYGYGFGFSTFDLTSVIVDKDAGIIRPPAYIGQFAFPVSVTYVAGRTVIDERIRMAVLDLVRINMRPQLGGNYSAFDETGSATNSPGQLRFGYFVPRDLASGLLRDFDTPRIA